MTASHDGQPAESGNLRGRIAGWLGEARRRLYPYRPRFWDWRFWAVQALVIGIAGAHDYIEATGLFSHLGALYFVPTAFFFVPVIYAALNFGFAGAVATSLWATAITAPNWVIWHHGLERWGDMSQMLIVNALAVFVGQRVDREVRARERAEAAETALRASEARYRGLFETSPVAVLVFRSDGMVLEANPAAGELFGLAAPELKGLALAELVGGDNAREITALAGGGEGEAPCLVLKRGNGAAVYLQPALTHADAGGQARVSQVLLQDVTEQRQQQAGLRAYAAHVLRAQEEERKRIAHELHDEAVQMLVLVCRRLDALEGVQTGAPPSVTEAIREVRGLAETLVERLRDFTRGLRPPTLDDLGLATSIRRLALDLAEELDIKTGLNVVGEERRLPPDIELGLFRIAQEALRNVERHARASSVNVTLSFGDREIRLEVRDDGRGFVAPLGQDGAGDGAHLGLLGMRERAEILDGRLEVQSWPGKGTRICATLPVLTQAYIEDSARHIPS